MLKFFNRNQYNYDVTAIGRHSVQLNVQLGHTHTFSYHLKDMYFITVWKKLNYILEENKMATFSPIFFVTISHCIVISFYNLIVSACTTWRNQMSTANKTRQLIWCSPKSSSASREVHLPTHKIKGKIILFFIWED